jgi:ATPase family associated with various cellular activities (AAA)
VVELPPLHLRALGPRRRRKPISRERAIAVLDTEVRTVALRTLVAIARGWDTRRLGYGNEGRHPFEMEVAAILGMNQGFAEEHLRAAAEHLARHEASLPPLAERRGPRTPLGILAAELGLSPLEVDILLVVAAPALWGETARLYGILANDPSRALVDEHLVGQILGVDRHDIARALDPGRPLLGYGVVRPSGARPRPFASLACDPIVLARLRRNGIPAGVGAALTVLRADRPLAEIVAPREVIATAVERLSQRTATPVRIAVRGRAGSGRRTLLAALAQTAGRRLGLIDATLLPRDPEAFVTALGAELGRALLLGLLPCVVALDEVRFEESGARELVRDAFRRHPGPVAVRLGVEGSAPFAAGHLALDLPALNEGERLEVWRHALAAHGLSVDDPAVLAARHRSGPGLVFRATAAVAGHVGDATLALETYLAQARDVELGAHARRIDRLADWSSLVLSPEMTDSLRELIGRVRHRRTVYERWGMERVMTSSRGITALFQGPPGTGKSMVAGVVASELGLPLYQIDVSKVMSKWLGETERHLGAIFDAAEDGQVVLLFDEADSLFAKRTEVRSSNDRYANLEVSYLLQRLDQFDGIAILTTNFGGSIDPAFRRRLSFRLAFPFPDDETRERLWRIHLPPEMPIDGALDLSALAQRYQLAGGHIRNSCLRAAFLAAEEEVPLGQVHLERAVSLEYAEIGKLSNDGRID